MVEPIDPTSEPVEIEIDKYQKAYETFIDQQGIQDSRLARIGFFQVVKEIQVDTAFSDPTFQAGVLFHIGVHLNSEDNGLKAAIKSLLTK